MDIEVCAFDHAHPLGEPATHPIARQASRLAALHPHGARRIRRAVTRQRLRCPRKVRYILPPLPQPGGTAACGVAEGRRKLSERSEFCLRPLDAGIQPDRPLPAVSSLEASPTPARMRQRQSTPLRDGQASDNPKPLLTVGTPQQRTFTNVWFSRTAMSDAPGGSYRT